MAPTSALCSAVFRGYSEAAFRQLPKIVKWGAPAVVLGTSTVAEDYRNLTLSMILVGWMAWPALTPNFKKEIGL